MTEPAARETVWHTLEATEAAGRLETDLDRGLRTAVATERLARLGRNEVAERPPRSVAVMVAGQFADFLIILLLAAAAVAALVGDVKDALVIAVIVVLNAIIGVVQEWRAERDLAALKRMLAPGAMVFRDGVTSQIPAAEVVPGDIVLLEAGAIVPADIRLVEAAALRIDESLLTGESVTVDKLPAPLADADLGVGDRVNMAFKGSVVTHGTARGVVTATGGTTELGRIAVLLGEAAPSQTPLQQRLTRFGHRLGVVVILISIVFFVFGVMRGEPALLMFLTAVSLAVAAVPEALPAVVTISLAVSAREMARRQALVRGLPAVEALGSVSYICTDKTGTLTQNRMHVAAVAAADGGPLDRLDGPLGIAMREVMALCTETRPDTGGDLIGDPTETAIARHAAEAGLGRADAEVHMPRIGVFPFDADRRRMTTLHAREEGARALMKGAPEAVLPLCRDALATQGLVPLDRAAALAIAGALAQQGMRVIAVARREIERGEANAAAETIEQAMTLVGFIGLIDPPRPEAKRAVALCRRAGITPVMITGDHPATARAVAQAIGIADGDDRVLTGADLRDMDDAAFDTIAGDIRVYARVDPAQKIRIVEALKRRGAFVAMTGDGVNDAPALKRADIGVAMGRDGTDVAKEASRLVLLDDNFATIVAAVREGRRIYDNIRKFIKYTMTSNSAEILTLLVPPLFGLPVALLPIHILWINLVTDALPGLALALEKEEREIMARPPRPPGESVFAEGMWQHIVWCGLLMGALSILTQAWAFTAGNERWQTMVFTVLTLSQMGHVLAIRSERQSLASIGLFSNPMLVWAIALTLALQLAIIYLPALNAIFNTASLTMLELALCFAISSLVFVAVEIEKWLRRRAGRASAPAEL